MASLAFVGLGSNLSAPAAQLKQALRELAQDPQLELLAVSAFYRSAALTLDDQIQPDYCNAVAAFRADCQALELLRILLRQEDRQGRRRQAGQRWQPRPLDLDLLSFGAERHASAELSLPHPQLAVRSFVLQPWRELIRNFAPTGLHALERLSVEGPAQALRPWSQQSEFCGS